MHDKLTWQLKMSSSKKTLAFVVGCSSIILSIYIFLFSTSRSKLALRKPNSSLKNSLFSFLMTPHNTNNFQVEQ